LHAQDTNRSVLYALRTIRYVESIRQTADAKQYDQSYFHHLSKNYGLVCLFSNDYAPT